MQRTEVNAVQRRRLLLLSTVAVLVGFATSAVDARQTTFDQPPRQAAGMQLAANADTAKLLEQAKQALAQHHPDVAAIFLRSALAADPDNADLRVELGTALFAAGDPTSAETELRSARQKGAPDAKVLPILYGVMLARQEDEQLLAQFPAPAESDTSALASETLRARSAALLRTGRVKDAATALDRALGFDRSVVNLIARAQLAQTMGQNGLASKMIDDAIAKSPKQTVALILKVDLLLQEKQEDKALEVANQLVGYYPNNAMALITRARVYSQKKDSAKALEDIDASLKVVPNMPLALYYKALLLEQDNHFKEAWTLVQDLPPTFVNSRPEIGSAVAQIAIRAGHVEIGTSMLSATVAKFPANLEARLRLASRYIELKDATRALQTLQPMSNSPDPRVVLLLAQAYDMEKQYSTAAEYAQKLSDAGLGGDSLKRKIAITNMQAGKIDTAIAELEKLDSASPGDPQVAGPLIGALIRKNDYEKAQEVTQKLTAAAPNQPYGPYFQGQLLLRKGDLDKAISAFSQAIEHDAKFIPALYERATAYGARGDLKAAEGDMRSILSADPNNMLAEINMAQLALRSGQKDAAETYLKHAVAAHPKEPLPVLVLASFEMQQKRFEDANAVVTGFLNRVPDNPNAIAMRAEILLASGKTDDAVNTLTDLAHARPKSPEIQMLLAKALSTAGQREKAVAAYQRALELSPSMYAAHLGLIQLALANKDPDAALKAAQNYADKQPGPLSAETLARTYATLKRTGDAVNVLLRTQKDYPNSATLLSLTAYLRAQGEAKRADDMLTDWIQKHPDDINARLAYATGEMQADPAAAETQYRAVLQLQPYNAGALNNLAWLLQQKNPKEAVSFAERAAKLAPDSPSVLDTLGWAKWLADDKTGALPILERAHGMDAANGEITYHLVLALDGNGRSDDAKKLLNQLLASKAQFSERSEAESLRAKWQ